MPRIDGVLETSLYVNDMERAARFYRDLLGFEVVLDTEMEGEMLEREVGLDGAHLRLVELAAPGDGLYLELLQYYAPAPADVPQRPCDVGAHHFALLVDDIKTAYETLVRAGVAFTAPPQEVDAGFFAGHWTVYCFDPDGLIVELWQLPSRS